MPTVSRELIIYLVGEGPGRQANFGRRAKTAVAEIERPETQVTDRTGHMGNTVPLSGEVWMPWKECSVVDERPRFVAQLLDGEAMS